MKIQLLLSAFILMTTSLFGQVITNYTTVDGLLDNSVNCVDVDASDNIWFGTQTGVSVFDGASTWTNYTMTNSPGLVDNTIQAIYNANNGDVWVGTDFGVSVFNGSTWTSYTTADGLGNNQIKCISENASGNIWFGTNNGASLFDGVSTWMNYGTADGLPFGGVTALNVHSNGDVWMGSGLGGEIIFDGTTFTILTINDGLIDNRIRAMAIDAQDNKWVATSEGISVLNSSNTVMAQHTRVFTLPAPDTLNPIEDIEIDSQGNIWAGIYVDYLVTEGGVSAFNGFQWVEYHVADGLVGPVVRALSIDSNDDVWVGTSSGISKIHDVTVGLNSISEEKGFNLYPNPANNQVTITFQKLDDTTNTIDIYDASMRIVKSIVMIQSSNELSFSITDLEEGMYFVVAGQQSKKLLVK